MASTLPFPFIMLLISMATVEGVEFDVGGDKGWATPSSNDQLFYNHWASKNRFIVNDTLTFVFKKDSVMTASEEEYKKCRVVSQPVFFSNGGDASYNLTHPGLFYFISGVVTHCQKGLKMVVKVLEPELEPLPPAKRSSASATTTAVFGAPLAASLAGVMFM